MKKLLILLGALFLFTSCTKESSNEYVGTRWETDGFYLINTLMGYKYHVYEFIDTDSVMSYWLDRNGKIASSDGEHRYEIDGSFIIVYHDTDDVRKLEVKDRITMILTSNTTIKYYKQ